MEAREYGEKIFETIANDWAENELKICQKIRLYGNL